MLRRGCTATSLSVPGHHSIVNCVHQATHVLSMEGLCLYDLKKAFPRLEQITMSGRCPASASDSASHYYCEQCCGAFFLQNRFRSLLANVRVCSSFPSAQSSRYAWRSSCFVGLLTLGSSQEKWPTAGGGHGCSFPAAQYIQTTLGTTSLKLLKAASPHIVDRFISVLL